MAVESNPAFLTGIVVPSTVDGGIARVVMWTKQPGEHVVANETLVRLEAANGWMEVPAPASGTLSSIELGPGAEVNPGETLGFIDAQRSGTRVMLAAHVEAAAGPASWGESRPMPLTPVMPAPPITPR